MNAYHGWIDDDVINHIAMVLKMIDSIYIPGVDSHQLRMKIFPLSLADEEKQWWINEGDGKITVWEELVEKFFCKFYPESYDGEEEMLDKGDNWEIDPLEFISRVNSSFDKHMKMDGRTKKLLFHAWMNERWNKRRMNDSILSSNNTTTDSFFKPYLITRGKCDTKKEDEQSQTKRKYSNTSEFIDEQPNKRMCKAKKFEAVRIVVIIEYLVNILELKRRYFEDYYSDNQYAVSIKEDTAYPCLHSPKTTKERRSIRRIQERQYAVFKLYGNKIFWKISNVVPTPRNSNTPNYNMHNMGKTIGELHALLNEYEKGLPKKAATPQVMAIQGGRIQKANEKSLNAKGKGKGKGKGKDTSFIPVTPPNRAWTKYVSEGVTL
ncbi:hypothetical protein Tco_0368214 [Tanacetum coccineum]